MGNEKDDQKKQEKWTLEDGLKFLKELREMPYTNDRVGQSFVTSFRKPSEAMKNFFKRKEEEKVNEGNKEEK